MLTLQNSSELWVPRGLNRLTQLHSIPPDLQSDPLVHLELRLLATWPTQRQSAT